MPSLKRRIYQLITATLCCLPLAGCRNAAPPARPPLVVDTAAASVETVPVIGSWVATLDGMVNAQIQPQVGGYVIRQDYKEGTVVRKGQVNSGEDGRDLRCSIAANNRADCKGYQRAPRRFDAARRRDDLPSRPEPAAVA